jgi:hypothetical protein
LITIIALKGESPKEWAEYLENNAGSNLVEIYQANNDDKLPYLKANASSSLCRQSLDKQ